MSRFSIKTAAAARNILLIVWVGFFVLNMAGIFYLYLDNWIERDNFLAALNQLNASYLPFIGAILAFYLGHAQRSKSMEAVHIGIAFYLALVFSVLWNVVIFLFILPPIWGVGMIEEAIQNIKDIGSLLSWLVFPAMGYYFGNPTTSNN